MHPTLRSLLLRRSLLLNEPLRILLTETVAQKLLIQSNRISNTHRHKLGRNVSKLKRRLPAERLILRLSRTTTNLIIKLALDVILVIIHPTSDRQRNDPSNLLTRHVLLHKLNDTLTTLGQNKLNLHQAVLSPRVGGISDHRRLSRRPPSPRLRVTLGIIRHTGNHVHVVLNHRRLVKKLRRANDRRHRGQHTAQSLVALDGNHHIVFIRLQRLNTFTVERILTIRPCTTELLAIVQHLRTGLVQLELQRLNLLHITHAIEMVRHLIITKHHKRMARSIRDLRRLD